MHASAPKVLAPPVPARAFHLPLSPAEDQSASARSASSARVSATANPTRAAKRVVAATHKQQQQQPQQHPHQTGGARRRTRSPQPMRPGEGADVVGAAAATAAAAASVFSGSNSSSNTASGGAESTGTSAGAGLTASVNGAIDSGISSSSISGGGLIHRTPSDAIVGPTPHASPAANSAPTPVSALLLVAASPFPARPLMYSQTGEGQGSLYQLSEGAGVASPSSPQVEDEAAMMAALSSALHAESEQDRLQLAAHHSQQLAQRQQVLSQALQSSPQRRVPTLPPAQLKSLVRSHVRHVGLSARLKTRTHVRELREAIAEERKTRALQAAQNIFLPPHTDTAAAPVATAAVPAAGSSTARIVRRRRAVPPAAAATPHSHRSRVAARNSSLSMLARLGLSDEDAHLLPQPLVSESTASSAAAPAAAAPVAGPSIVVPWPSWMPPGLSAASLSAAAASAAATGTSTSRAGESKEPDEPSQQQQQASGSAWRDPYGSLIGVESFLSASPTADQEPAAAAPTSHSRFPPIPSLPLHLASSSSSSSAPSLSLALSPRMPPIVASVVAGGGMSAREKDKQRSARLLKGSFAPSAC